MSGACDYCGGIGHAEACCSLRLYDERRRALGQLPATVKPKPISDPADRDAGPHTVFLLGGKG